MAEVFGIIAGAAGLAGLFTTCVDSFQYIRLGQNFGKDYEGCQVKLDVVALRLSRWGVAAGLGRNPYPNPPRCQPLVTATADELKIASRVFSRLLESLKEAKRASEKFKTDAEEDSSAGTEIYDPNTRLEAHFRNLHVTTTDIVARRHQDSANIWQKTKWALYSKTKFDSLVEDVTGYIDTLENLFPVAKEVLERVSLQEVSEISDDESLKMLSNMAGNDDKMLAKAAAEVLAAKGETWKNFEIAGEKSSSIYVGHDYAAGEGNGKPGSTFDTFKIGGSGFTHVGHRYRGVGSAADGVRGPERSG